MAHDFETLVTLAQQTDDAFMAIDRQDCVQAARTAFEQSWAEVKQHHDGGASGGDVIMQLSKAADEVLSGIVAFALRETSDPAAVLDRIAICALGGYGRLELSPYSDLDVCLLYTGELDDSIKAVNRYLVPFLWDLGFKVGYVIHRVAEAVALAKEDPEVFTTYAQARLITGDKAVLGRLKIRFAELREGDTTALEAYVKTRVEPENLPQEYQDLHHPEPNIKENMGGLRDYHAALWMLVVTHELMGLDDWVSMGFVGEGEHLDLIDGLDFMWRIRNEMHFHTGRSEDILSFELQRHIAQAFEYGSGSQASVDRLMQDYYRAAGRMRMFLRIAQRVVEHQLEIDMVEDDGLDTYEITTHNGQIFAGMEDEHWFDENHARLMELFWVCSRHGLPVSPATEQRVHESLHLVNDEFRESAVVRRFFLGICKRPFQAGFALRQAANAGLLSAYLPEFAEVSGIVRYEDFHSYPVDEHTLRALEALEELQSMEGSVAEFLQHSLECISDPHILVLAILFHDLGKVDGEEHTEAGVRIVHEAGARIGLSEADIERVAFLVKHHMVMTHMSMYRDIDDPDIVNTFAETMKTDERLRELLLLSFADLKAVGPTVWTDWKGALLVKLYLKAERIVQGRKDTTDGAFWTLPKADEITLRVKEPLKEGVQNYLEEMGERYFFAFPAKHIAHHMECLDEARTQGMAVRSAASDETGMSSIVVCAPDRSGLFSDIAGCFAAQMIDVDSAALYTSSDGFAVDCFTVFDALNNRALTPDQVAGVARALHTVILEGSDLQSMVGKARERIYVMQSAVASVKSRVDFDNDSSETDTVIDIEAGDRTGLLYDVSRTLASVDVDIRSARIVTDARRVRDSFYVRKANGKLENHSEQEAVEQAVVKALSSRAATDAKGDTE